MRNSVSTQFKLIAASLFGLLIMTAPFTVSAQSPGTFAEVVGEFISILNVLFPLLVLAAIMMFFLGLAKYVFRADEEPMVQQGKFLMTWGLLAIFVLFSIWGILGFIYGEFGFTDPFGAFLLPTS
ncbi:MAG: hypothetical protein WDZ82_02740 [Candidatus Paceibacterota bacterium]